MRKKYKMTGCARFFLVMIVLAPLAYLGAAYYNGQDGIQNIKNFLGIGQDDSSDTDSDTYTGTSEDLRDQMQKQERQINDLIKENDDLQEQLDAAQKEIEHLKGQLDAQ